MIRDQRPYPRSQVWGMIQSLEHAWVESMDLIGLVIAAALVVGVFALFDAAIRVVGGTVGEVRYSVAPAVLGGLRAWVDGQSEELASRVVAPRRHGVAPRSRGDGPPPGQPAPAASGTRLREGGFEVPVAPVVRRGRSLAAG